MEHPFKKIPQKKVSDKVLGQIRDLITTGKLLPGDQLPPERELTQQFAVSRASVREALLKLECLGFLEQRHGDGTFVKSLSETPVLTALKSLSSAPRFIEDLFEFRMVVEPWAAAAAARRATETDIRDMRTLLSEMMDHAEKKKGRRKSPLELHILIARATHNMILIQLMVPLFKWMKRSADMSNRLKPDRAKGTDTLPAQYTRIVDAIEHRDAQTASTLMRAHLARAGELEQEPKAGTGVK